MKKLSLLSVIGLSLTSLIWLGSAASGTDGFVDEGYIPPDLPIQGTVNINFKEGRLQFPEAGAPYLVWKSGKEAWGGVEEELLCSSTGDSKCLKSEGSLEFYTRLTVCKTATSLDCIEGIKAKNSSGEFIGEFVEKFPAKNVTTYTSDLSQRLPEASSGGFWKFTNLNHQGGDQYFVDARLRGTRSMNQSLFTNTSLNLSIYAASKASIGRHPVSPELGSAIDDGSGYVQQRYTTDSSKPYLGMVGIYGGYQNENLDCVMSGDSLCATRHAIPSGTEFTVVVRLSSSPSGWMHGRLDNPVISIESLEPKPAVKLSISGESTRVPAVGISTEWSKLPKSLQDSYLNGGFKGTKYSCRWCSDDPLKNTLGADPSYSGTGAMDELKAWLPVVGDKSTADLNSWSIRTLTNSEMSGSNSCFKKSDQISGLVMTNATVYSAGPPEFSKSEGTLNYQVVAPHLMSNGGVMKGQYNLVIRSDVARCLYKFSSAPISAVISVINASGSSEIATTVVGEKNGWLYLQAKNFEFSAPTVKVKLTQEGAAKTSTITCVKGKTSKKVTSVNPKCPSGYKKK